MDCKDVADLRHCLRAKPAQANRVLARVSKMLNLAETWGLRPLDSNPCPRIGRYRESKRERFLSGTELRRLGEARRQDALPYRNMRTNQFDSWYALTETLLTERSCVMSDAAHRTL